MAKVRIVSLTGDEVKGLIDRLGAIEMKDGKPGFARAEYRQAKKLLRAEGLIARPKLFKKKALAEFLTQLRKAALDIPAGEQKVCREERQFVTVCDVMAYSALITVSEGKKGFSVSITRQEEKLREERTEDVEALQYMERRRRSRRGCCDMSIPSTLNMHFR